jgi:hypothetical protein
MTVLAATRDVWLGWVSGDGAIGAALALFFIAIFAGVPVGFVLLLATAAYLWATGAASMVALPQSMVNGTGNFILLAIPFFILAGLIMERGGISVRLVRFIQTLVGHLRGGLLQVTVLSMYIVSGLSGSKPADVAAVGTVMRDQLRARHGAAEGAAVLAASAVMGETVPPSIAMLIVGSITNVSVAAMFIGGFAPAALMALCLMLLIYVRARRTGASGSPRAPLRVILRAGLGAVLPLLMPGMLLAGILLGWATPTEVAALAVLYGLALSVFAYGEMDLRSFLRTVSDTAALTGGAAVYLRGRFGFLLDADGRLSAATSGRASSRRRQQHRNLYDQFGGPAHRRWRAARRAALAQRARAAAAADRKQAWLEWAALCSGADHRYGRRWLHAAGRRWFLRVLRDHAQRRRDGLAGHASLPLRCSRRPADRCVCTVVYVVSAELFRFSRITPIPHHAGNIKGGKSWIAEHF